MSIEKLQNSTPADWPETGAHLAGPLARGEMDDILPPYIGCDLSGQVLFVSATATDLLSLPKGRVDLTLDALLPDDLAQVVQPLLQSTAGQIEQTVRAGPRQGMRIERRAMSQGHVLWLFHPAEQGERGADPVMDRVVEMHACIFASVDVQMRLVSFLDPHQDIFRFRPSDVGRPLDEVSAHVNITQLTKIIRRAAESDAPIVEILATNDGARAFQITAAALDADAQDVMIAARDVTDVSALEAEVGRLTALSQQRLTELEELYDITPQAMGLISADLTFLRVNKRLATINGLSVAGHLGAKLEDIIPELFSQVKPPVMQVLKTGRRIENLRVEGRTARSPTEDRVWETDWYPVRDPDDHILGVGVNVRDVTEQVAMGEELRRVMGELQHRVKNMLTNVNALVARAGREATTDAEVFQVLSQRIRALSETHSLLVQSNWNSAPLRSVIEAELIPVYGMDRVTLKGPRVDVSAPAALALGMAVHELATNAAKYGAFSDPEGRVSLIWERRDDGESDQLIFRWEETGGPRLAPPESEGFGSQLIRSTVEGTLEGDVQFDWQAKGLRCSFDVPMAALNDFHETFTRV